MKPLSLRASLTAWFVGLTMLLLGGFSFTLYSFLGRTLRGGLDAQLQERAEALVGVCDWDEDAGQAEFDLLPALAEELGAGQPGRGLEVWTWPGLEVLHRSGQPIEAELPAVTEAGAALPRFAFAELGSGAPRRLLTLIARCPAIPAQKDEPAKPAFEICVRVADSLAPVEVQLARVAWRILALVGISVVVVLAFGLFLSRRFVRPLDELGRAAANVRAGAQARMPHRGTEDEVDRLAKILEGAFASLEDALNRQARFTADAAHELRNPISVIRSAAEVALRHERTSAEYREFLLDVLATADRMGRIVEALLMLARLDAGLVQRTFLDVDLVTVARESAGALAEGAERVHIADSAPSLIRGDPGLLRVLADNLLSNALRYSRGLVVDVDVQSEVSGCVSLRVRDRGPGVPVPERQRVFERFYRVESARPDPSGAGLGLSIVAEVARLHAAECNVEDAQPGTRVTVRFPAASNGGTRNAARCS